MLRKIFFIGVLSVISLFGRHAAAQEFWPPTVGLAFPDFELIDQGGERLQVSDFKGKVIFIEFVGMNCPACQAFSGGHSKGAYNKNALQQNLSSIEEYFPQYTGGLSLPGEGLIFLQILLYDMNLGPPTAEDARAWAEHFGFSKERDQYVLVPTRDLRGDASYNLIPGFQLIDKSFIVRSDSSGHHPRDNLYKTLLPMVPALLK